MNNKMIGKKKQNQQIHLIYHNVIVRSCAIGVDNNKHQYAHLLISLITYFFLIKKV